MFGSLARSAEPLGALVAALKQQRPGLATTAASNPSRWLFPGRRLDASLHPEHMRRRLRRHGILARPGRAADWTRAATGDWARYAAQASRQLQQG
jgi:hypothetical protein